MNRDDPLKILEALGCSYAFYFRQGGQPPVLQANCQVFPSASIIKIPILLAWVQLERQGLLGRDELCCLDDEPQVQGAGFSWLLRGRVIPFQDVLLMMIALSDNLCTNLVIRHIGLERLGRIFRDDFGFQGTEVQRKLMDYEARSRGLDNRVAVGDAIRFYDLLETMTPQERTWVDALFLANQDDLLFKRNIPRDTLDFYHKTGSIPNVLHDWGYTRDCRIFLFTAGVRSEPQAFDAFGRLGQWLVAARDN